MQNVVFFPPFSVYFSWGNKVKNAHSDMSKKIPHSRVDCEGKDI